MKHAIRKILPLAFLSLFLISTTGCASRTARGAGIGAAGGAVVGGVIGAATGSTAKGAIIGAAIGGAAGAIIASQMDDLAEDLDNDLDNATVERVGEGVLVTFDSGILFDFDSDALRAAARQNLRELKAALDEQDGTELLIVGHTDSVGGDDYNLQLSERRAQSAARYLRTLGLTGSSVEIMGLGESEPVTENDTEEGQQANRRVEVAVFASAEHRAEMQRIHGGN